VSNSENIVIFHNNIQENDVQAFDTAPTDNYWHHPDWLEGNYWSDYTGADDGSGVDKHSIAGDGIGDTDIPHPGPNYDDYPFLEPIAQLTENHLVFVDDDFTPDEIGYGIWKFSSVGEGIQAVARGGTVMVAAGVYSEGRNGRLDIAKSMNLIGEDAATVQINDCRIYIRGTRDVEIQGVTIQGDTTRRESIRIQNCLYVTIKNSQLYHDIILQSSNHVHIIDNSIYGYLSGNWNMLYNEMINLRLRIRKNE